MNMAKTGKKILIYEITNLEDLENIIEFANFRGKINGLRLHIDFKHDQGLYISVAGPKDRINLFDHQMRDYVAELLNDQEDLL